MNVFNFISGGLRWMAFPGCRGPDESWWDIWHEESDASSSPVGYSFRTAFWWD